MIHILYHADSDGRFAGWCAWSHFTNLLVHDQAEVALHEVQYGRPIPLDIDSLKRSDSVYIVDFSYSADIMVELSRKVGILVVLDHHKTVEEEIQKASSAADTACDFVFSFDVTKSGALLAWEYFNPDAPPPLVCELVNDRDLWVFEFGDKTRALETFLRSTPQSNSLSFWTRLVEDPGFLRACLSKGLTFLDYERRITAAFVDNSRNWQIVEVGGFKTVVYEGMGILHSELAEEFYTRMKDIEMTMEWRRKEKDKIVFSLRTRHDHVDVSSVAKSFGGGGHQKAAGFSKELAAGFEFLKSLA